MRPHTDWETDIYTFAKRRPAILEWLWTSGLEPDGGFLDAAAVYHPPSTAAVRWCFQHLSQHQEHELLDSMCSRILQTHPKVPALRPAILRHPEYRTEYIEIVQELWRHGARAGQECAVGFVVEQVFERVAAVHGLLDGVALGVRKTAAAALIQRRWAEAIAAPEFALCRKRLRQEYEDMPQPWTGHC